jgi:hypothetical protein
LFLDFTLDFVLDELFSLIKDFLLFGLGLDILILKTLELVFVHIVRARCGEEWIFRV